MAIQQTRRALAPDRMQEADSGSGAQQRGQQLRRNRENGRQWRQAASKGARRDGLATFLGWFSIGLGVAEVVAPRGLARLIGLSEDHPTLLRVMGLREITSGVGILTNPRPAGWVWSRVAGDALDLSLLGVALRSEDSNKARVAVATAAVIGVTALDVLDAQQLSRDDNNRAIRIKSITINRSPEEVYAFWRNFENLPRFMSHLESVRETGQGRSHWVVNGPAGTTVEWDAEITEDRPNEMIAWRSLEGADVENSGSVRFERAAGGRGTEVRVEIEYNPPGGVLGAGLAKLTGEEPGQQLKDDLYRFKQVMETGEVVRSDASIHRGMHPAKPAAGNAQ